MGPDQNKEREPQKRLRIWNGVSDIANIEAKNKSMQGIEPTLWASWLTCSRASAIWTTDLQRIGIKVYRYASGRYTGSNKKPFVSKTYEKIGGGALGKSYYSYRRGGRVTIFAAGKMSPLPGVTKWRHGASFVLQQGEFGPLPGGAGNRLTKNPLGAAKLTSSRESLTCYPCNHFAAGLRPPLLPPRTTRNIILQELHRLMKEYCPRMPATKNRSPHGTNIHSQ